jgi:type VI secretion system protein ImpK
MIQRPGILALCFQESITAIVRLRAGRQSATDAVQFRQEMRAALEAAARDARDLGGYTSADVRCATFAVVAFLDESILNSRDPAFADWARQPLQEELFGIHVAGEVFFENLQELLARPDSSVLADLLEVYSLCLILGFAGRHSGGRRSELARILGTLRERIRRVRGEPGDLSPSWTPPPHAAPPRSDPWMRRLTIAAAACAALAVLLFAAYSIALQIPVLHVRDMALEVRR